jgi:hypothetical protein
MNSLLLIIGLPGDPAKSDRTGDENKLMMLCKKLRPTKERHQNIEHFQPNVWRIPAENGLSFLRYALELAGESGCPCRILPLTDDPQWLHGVPSDGD